MEEGLKKSNHSLVDEEVMVLQLKQPHPLLQAKARTTRPNARDPPARMQVRSSHHNVPFIGGKCEQPIGERVRFGALV